jgi:hypothetical protein
MTHENYKRVSEKFGHAIQNLLEFGVRSACHPFGTSCITTRSRMPRKIQTDPAFQQNLTFTKSTWKTDTTHGRNPATGRIPVYCFLCCTWILCQQRICTTLPDN